MGITIYAVSRRDRSRLRQVDAHIDRWRNLPKLAVDNPKTSESALCMADSEVRPELSTLYMAELF